ncbi:neurotrypsin-like [Asterias amurensis]|uniref:neurotrypsin-like n=1 Tax=Asterias amurensis TaxID=7602 RepID=UPI003AB7A63A
MMRSASDVSLLVIVVAAIVNTCTTAYFKDGDVRLDTGQNEVSPYEGVVQVYNNGSWGGVCAGEFGNEEAMVVCRQLGYRLHTRTAKSQDMFPGNNNMVVTVSWLHCYGIESSLGNCKTVKYETGASLTVCLDDWDVAAVACSPIDDYAVRLMGGSNRFEGRVEVYHRDYSSGIWGTICNDYWGYSDSKVICRQLKYGNPEEARERNGDYYKAGSAGMRVLLDNVGCYGDETTLASCPHRGWYIENCYGNTELAAVVCEPAIEQGYLTVGAIAGIVTGSILVIIFVMMLGAVCCKQMKNKKRSRTDPTSATTYNQNSTYMISRGSAAAPGVHLPAGNQPGVVHYNVAAVPPGPPPYSVVGPPGSAVAGYQ